MERGWKNRSTGATLMNADSSRYFQNVFGDLWRLIETHGDSWRLIETHGDSLEEN